MLTSFNIGKAFHIDDTFYIEAAEQIKKDPFRPMSGMVNWGNDLAPMHTYNQPPLFMYLIALTTYFFGTAEFALHLLVSLFSFLALFYFQQINRLLNHANQRTILVVFAFSPALIINQNVMIDVPLLSILLGSTYYFLKASRSRQNSHYLLSFFLLGLGLWMKYSLLPVLAGYVILLLLRQQYKAVVYVLIPLSMLAAWSCWNYWEYGAIHLWTRSSSTAPNEQLFAFFACLGSISVFTILYVAGVVRRSWFDVLLYGSFLLVGLSICLFYADFISSGQYSFGLNILFMINGIALFSIIFFHLYQSQRDSSWQQLFASDQFAIVFLAVCISLFLVLFAPFMATRHVLLVIPFLLFSGSSLLDHVSKPVQRLALGATIGLGLALGISDWKLADFYRVEALKSTNTSATVWSAGHWGWQWYSQQAGMLPYQTTNSIVKVGDLIICPGKVHIQQFSSNIRLEVLHKKWIEADLWTLFSGSNAASMYLSFYNKAPWCLSKSPIDTIYVCKVVQVKGRL